MASMMKTALVAFVFLYSVGCASRITAPADANEVVATIDGQAIYENDLLPAIDSQLRQLRTREYELKRRALDVVIQQKSLEAEAARKGVSVRELLMVEVDSKVNDPTDAEARAFYEARKDSLKHPFDAELQAEIIKSLKQERLREARSAYIDQLVSHSNVAILLAPHRAEVSHDPSRLRGNPDAPVTIVEFSDFECPYCSEVQTTLKQVLAKYGENVRLVFKHLPSEGHRNSLPAARAAYCAAEQDRFWEFHDALFALRNLSPAAFEQIAGDLGLGMAKFRACLNSEQSRSAIVKDIEAARLFRIESTPSFIVNGRLVKGALSFAEFQKIIERELDQRAAQTQSSVN